MVELSNSEHSFDHADLDQSLHYSAPHHILNAEELAYGVFEGLTAAVYRGLYDDSLVMVTEIEGGVARDLLREENVTPDGDQPFHLRAFPDGIVTHIYEPERVHEEFGSPEDVPAQFLHDAMEEQVQTNADYAEQWAEMVEDDWPDDEDPTGDWPDPTTFPRLLLRQTNPLLMDSHGVWYTVFEDEGGDLTGAVEFPSVGIKEVYDIRRDFGKMPYTHGTTNHNHFQVHRYDDGVDRETAECHLKMLADHIYERTKGFATHLMTMDDEDGYSVRMEEILPDEKF